MAMSSITSAGALASAAIRFLRIFAKAGSCFLHGFDSLWLPASLLQKNRQKQLADALFAASRHQQVQLHINKGLAGAPSAALASTRQTATNPAVIDAFALVIIADGHGLAYPGLAPTTVDMAAAHTDAHNIDLAAAEHLDARAPGAPRRHTGPPE